MTLAELRQYLTNANFRAFGRVLREGESLQTDDAYRLRFNGYKLPHSFFDDFSNHPRVLVPIPNDAQGRYSTAAGAYMYTYTTWSQEVEPQLKLLFGGPVDFSPAMQEAGLVVLLSRTGKGAALQMVVDGKLDEAIALCRGRWTSLPGAAENGRVTFKVAHAVYEKYGGTYGPAVPTPPKPVVPIEDKSTEYTPPAGGITEPEKEQSMGAAIPLLASILPSVLQLFSGKAQAQITKATGASPDVAGQFLQSLAANVGAAVGIPVTDNATAMQAVGKFTEAPTPAAVQALEAKAVASVDELLRVADKSAQIDGAYWAAQLAGKDAAAARARDERWDMTPWLVWFAGIGTSMCSVALLGAIVYQSIAKTIDPVLLGLAGPLLAITYSAWKSIFDYRFDGTKESGEQSRALTDVIRQRGQA